MTTPAVPATNAGGTARHGRRTAGRRYRSLLVPCPLARLVPHHLPKTTTFQAQLGQQGGTPILTAAEATDGGMATIGLTTAGPHLNPG